MKGLGIVFVLFILAGTAWGQERRDIFDERGQREGYTREDPYNKDRLDFFDKDSKRTGYAVKDPYSADQWNLYDKDGQRKGYVKENRLFDK
jgi:hypothetical protein